MTAGIVGSERWSRHGFTQVPNAVLRATNLSLGAKVLYGILLDHAWQGSECFPGYALLCERMASSPKLVGKCMNELVSSRLIRSFRRGQGKTNLYVIDDLDAAVLDGLSAAVPPRSLHRSDLVNSPGGSNNTPLNRPLPLPLDQDATVDATVSIAAQDAPRLPAVPKSLVKKLSPGGVGYSFEFASFWSAYPRKESKYEAWTNWQALVAGGVAPETLIRAAATYAAYTKRLGTDTPHILHGSTFLGPQRRWEDYSDGLPPIVNGNGRHQESARDQLERLVKGDT